MEQTVSASLLCKQRMNVAQGLALSTSMLTDTHTHPHPHRYTCVSAYTATGQTLRSVMQMGLELWRMIGCITLNKTNKQKKMCKLQDHTVQQHMSFSFPILFWELIPLREHILSNSPSHPFKPRNSPNREREATGYGRALSHPSALP